MNKLRYFFDLLQVVLLFFSSISYSKENTTNSVYKKSLKKNLNQFDKILLPYEDRITTPPCHGVMNNCNILKLKTNLEKKAKVFINKNTYFSNCLKNSDDNKVIKVNKINKFLCKKKPRPIYQKVVSKYQIVNKIDYVKINISIHLSYTGKKINKNESINKIKQSIPCITHFFAKHGIILNMKLGFNENYFNKLFYDHKIQLKDVIKSKEDASYKKWFSHKLGNLNLNENHVCYGTVHEILHLLGLPDLYPDPDCPDREIGDWNNILYNSFKYFSSLRLFHKDIKNIISPLCKTQ
jgi:hypothetical protein